jgi:branched-chain amino acid transport system permease protein
MILAQLIANSIIIGSIYALVAAGFALVYSTNKFMHFAHGVMVAFSGYMLFLMFSILGVNFYISCFITLILAGLLGWISYRVVYEPLQKRKSSNVILLIASLGLLILLENTLMIFFGPDIKTINYFGIAKGIDILGAIVTPIQIAIIIITLVLLVGLYFFMNKSKIGRNMRAVADNKELTSITGINYRSIADLSFIIGSVLAGIAGILIAIEQNLTPAMGTGLIIKGFTGAVIGSIMSVPGSIIGSYILGFAENFGVWFLPSEYKDAIAFILLFIFLLFKPNGLFGVDKGVRNK